MDRETRAKRIADLHVFYGQNEVVEELIRAGKIDEEYMYPFVDTDDEVFEWWLVSPYLAQELKQQGEVIIDALGCHWWGRQSSGQAIYMDAAIQEIAGRKTRVAYCQNKTANWRDLGHCKIGEILEALISVFLLAEGR